LLAQTIALNIPSASQSQVIATWLFLRHDDSPERLKKVCKLKKLIGILLLVAGWGFAAWAALAGLAFCAIMLIGFIGTGGREGGGEFMGYFGYALIAVTAGYLVGKLGNILIKQANAKNKIPS
jgi:hypothetical protein